MNRIKYNVAFQDVIEIVKNQDGPIAFILPTIKDSGPIKQALKDLAADLRLSFGVRYYNYILINDVQVHFYSVRNFSEASMGMGFHHIFMDARAKSHVSACIYDEVHTALVFYQYSQGTKLHKF